MSANTCTRERNQYSEVFEYYNQWAMQQGLSAASPLLMRELYGEQVAPYTIPDITPPSDAITHTLDLLSQGFELDDVAAYTRRTLDGVRTRIATAFGHYDTPEHPIPHRRLTVIKTALELGHIVIKPKPLNSGLLNQLTLQQLTAFHLTELGVPRRIAARKMFLSEDGFKSHLSQCRTNLGALNSSHAVRVVREQGIFSLTRIERVPHHMLRAAGVVFE